MDKRSNNILIIIIITLLFAVCTFAQQSDYEIVEEFQKACRDLTVEIKESDSPEKLEYVARKMTDLQEKYSIHERLLDKALYPETFGSAMEGISSRHEIALEKISLKKDLHKTLEEKRTLFVELSAVNVRVDSLAGVNSDLSGRISDLRSKNKKDKRSMAEINRLLAKMKENIKDRDNLVANMINNLFQDFQRPDLSDEKKESMVKMIDRDFFKTIQSSIDDNISFLETRELLPQDLVYAGEQHKNFTKLWGKVSSDLVETYLNDQDRNALVKRIETSLKSWKNKISDTTWDNLYAQFEQNGFDAHPFNSADQFQSSLSLLLDELQKEGDKERHDTFVKQVWKKNIDKVWLPHLLAEKKMSKDQVVKIRAAFKDDSATNPYVYYGGIAALILFVFVIGSVIIKSKKD